MLSYIRMEMWSHASFKGISAIEEFTNIGPNVMLNKELASRMLILELPNIKN